MTIISVKFVIFLIIALMLYFIIPGKHQWKALLIISYMFYLVSGFETIAFLVFTTLTTFWGGIRIGKINEEYDFAVRSYNGPNEKITRAEKLQIKAEEDKRKRKYIIFILVINFGILFALKYTNIRC